jgi:glycosyltransferase involved in cell wall biosynthesis
MIAEMPIPKIKTRASAPPDQPFWSVVIPTYNPDKALLEISLRSILEQDFGPEQMEILVVDDCSPNGSPEAWIKEWAGDRVKVINNSHNRGLAKIWNFCVESSVGEWVHILHQDDVVAPGYYESLQAGIEANPEVGAAFSRFSYVDGEGNETNRGPLEQAEPGVLDDFLERLVTSEVRVICACISVKRETYESVGGFRSDLCHALDWEMWVRIANDYPIFYHPDILASWRQHDAATTSSQMLTGENVRDIGRAIRIWRGYIHSPNRKTLAKESSAYWAKCGLSLAENYHRVANLKSSKAQISAALSCHINTEILCKSTVLWMKIAKSRLRGKR